MVYFAMKPVNSQLEDKQTGNIYTYIYIYLFVKKHKPKADSFNSVYETTVFWLQVIANCLLLLTANLLGLTSCYLADNQQRRAFLETRQSLEMKLVIEEQSAEQVCVFTLFLLERWQTDPTVIKYQIIFMMSLRTDPIRSKFAANEFANVSFSKNLQIKNLSTKTAVLLF
jgi:hypothetical protein